MNAIAWSCRLAIVSAAAFVLVQLAPVIRSELADGSGCPDIGPVPACYVVAGCYALMGIVAIFHPVRLQVIYWTGWAPVFLLALSGSVLEISGTPTCPAAANGTPMCFYSLALATVLAVLFIVTLRILRFSHNKFHLSGS